AAAHPGVCSVHHRVHLLSQMGNVEIYRESPLSAADVAATGAEHVLVATGSSWRRDGRGRTSFAPVPGLDQATLMTPDDILAGARPPHGPVVVHDDDGYVMAAAIAELLAREGHAVTYVASDARVSFWTVHTVEHARVHRRLSELGVAIVTNEAVTASGGGAARLTHVLTGSEREIACGTLVSVTSREPDEALYHALAAEAGALASLVRIGDCRAPGLIAMAVYDGHAAGRAIGAAEGEVFVKRDRVVMG
nr:NADH:flavin oxidoreductase [Rhizobiaceae bacterium]